jgi:hypothetical protein
MQRDSDMTKFTAATFCTSREVHTGREPIQFVMVIQATNQYKQDLTLLSCDTMLLGEWFLTYQWPIFLYAEPVQQTILDYMTLENEDTPETTNKIVSHPRRNKSHLDQDIIPARDVER